MNSNQGSQKKCSICHSKPYLDARKLCSKCEEYANQDYVSDTEVFWISKRLNEFKSDITGKAISSPWSKSDPASEVYKIINKAELTEQERVSLICYHLEGKSIPYIATNLNFSQGTIKSLLNRGMKKLRQVDIGQLNFCPKKDLELCDPYDFYSCCPKCKSIELEALSDCEGECSRCGWGFNFIPHE